MPLHLAAGLGLNVRLATIGVFMAGFKRIGVVGKYRDVKAMETLKELLRFLSGQHRDIILEDKTARALPGKQLPTRPIQAMAEDCDLVIVVGGDGSLLGAARELAQQQLPVLGINRGRLGFLTDIHPRDLYRQVSEVLSGDYSQEERTLLEAKILHHNEQISVGQALNDIVLHQGKMVKMIEFNVSIDGHFVFHQRSDGLIIATPTGSTAYALSGGGPIIQPCLDAFVMVPMFAHTLSSRPIVVSGESNIEIHVSEDNDVYPRLNCDSQLSFSLAPGDKVQIYKSPHRLTLLHPREYNYYTTLREKLHWGHNL